MSKSRLILHEVYIMTSLSYLPNSYIVNVQRFKIKGISLAIELKAACFIYTAVTVAICMSKF